MNYELLTYQTTTHRQELLHAAEQRRLLAHISEQHTPALQHTIALCGVMLIKIGMKLKEAELYKEQQAI